MRREGDGTGLLFWASGAMGALCLVLAACAAVRPTVPVCLPVKAWTAAEQAALAAQLASVAAGSPIDLAIQDYERMRDAARACAGAKP